MARDENIVLIALPNTSEGDLSFPVRMIVAGRFAQRGQLPTGFHLFADKRAIPVPSVVAPRSQRAAAEGQGHFSEHGMKVEETSWTVHLPNELDVEPVEGKGTNLALVSSDRIQLNQQRATLEDANYLLGVLESKSSGKAKYNAAVNLKRLEADLSNFGSVGRSQRYSGELQTDGGADFVQQNRSFQDQYRKALDRIQVDDSKQRVTIVDESGSLEGQDEQAQRAQIFRNNDQLWRGNAMVHSGKDKQPSAREGQEFNFKAPPTMPPSKSGEKTKKGGKTAAGKGKDLVDERKLATRALRKRRQEQSKSQIAGLNAIAQKEEQKKLVLRDSPMQQVEQPPQQAVGGFRNNVPMLVPGTVVSTGRGGQGPANEMEFDTSPAGAAGVVGGLSVEFEIPTGGQTLQFATTGENPMLELSMRPRESIQLGLNLLWAIAWLAVGSGVIVALRRPGTVELLKRHLAKGLLGVGLISYLLLPSGLAWLGFLVFLAGLSVFAFQNRAAEECPGKPE